MKLLSWLESRVLPFELKTVLLPVSFQNGFATLQKSINDFHPDIAVATGFAKNRTELTVEKIGINWMDARIADNDGYQPLQTPIDPQGPDGIFARLPLSQMVAASMSVGVTAKISTTAGEYVCNHVLYSLLHSYPKLRCGFIHLQSSDVFAGVEAMLKVASLPMRN
jgi:pyroglutamyl-peptidase